MGLKLIIAKLEDAAEEVRHLYKPHEGGFRLDVDGVVQREKLDEFRNNNVILTNQVSDLTAKLKPFEGMDPAKYTEYETIAKGKPTGEQIETMVAERVTKLLADKDKEIESITEKFNASQGELKNSMIMTEIRAAASTLGANPLALPDIEFRANGKFDLVNGKPVVMKDGQIEYGADGVTPKTPSEWIKDLGATAPHLFTKNSGGGAGNPGGVEPGQKDRSQMTPLEKIQYGVAHQ